MEGWLDGRLAWEIDYPESHEDWTPFLASQVRIDASQKILREIAEEAHHLADEIAPPVQDKGRSCQELFIVQLAAVRPARSMNLRSHARLLTIYSVAMYIIVRAASSNTD